MPSFYKMRPVYIGIDPTAGRRPIHYAVLDEKLRIVAQGEGDLETVLAVVGKHESAVCAVDAPQSPNGALLSRPEVREKYGLRPDATTWAQFKVCEYLLRQRGIGIYNTPAEAATAKGWMKLGWELYDRLITAGFALHRISPELPRTYLEVHPHASFTTLLGHLPYKKDTLEGRLQRQLLLADLEVDVPDAMAAFEEITRHRLLTGTLDYRGLLTHDQLDALVSAYTAYVTATQPGQVTWVGDEWEGEIVVPVAELREKYGKPKR